MARRNVNKLNPRPPVRKSTNRETAEWMLSECVNTPDGCMLWPHCVGADGYGQVRVADGMDKCHRVAYRGLVGEIPNGLFVCHKCDDPRCCRPEHLFLGTHVDNMRDMVRKGRSCVGEKYSRAKLDNAAVRAIREMYAGTDKTIATIALMFGVSQSHACKVINHTSWAHVT